ncbi:MAG: protein kinase domain-containing protein, partial [Bacteroidota bacterium]
MDSDRWSQIQEVFFGALEMDIRSRTAFLDATGDVSLRDEVEAMLAAHERDQDFLLEGRLFAGWRDVDHFDDLLETHLGPYRVKALLGEGGMGNVYLAERDDDQYRQEVALKLIRPGLHSPEIVSRFRRERQILATLQHPHIARLLDGGVAESGRPYLVMEFVVGVPITQYCDVHRLTISQRLRLFQTVARVVQFAHQNLVVHRDLKPSNILVADGDDGIPQIKLLDFGIAKLLDPEEAAVPDALTRLDLRLLTPEYAAPEQVRGGHVTTATDVYALGVLLYELVTGSRPYRLPKNQTSETERIICEEIPARPSTAVHHGAGLPPPDKSVECTTLDRVCHSRRTQPSRLRRTLRGDLDTITMMALRKEPERRYASAAQLADDIGRYLAGQPVIARADTFRYRMSKFVRRHQLGLSVATGILLILAAGFIYGAEQARRIAQERDKATLIPAFLADVFTAADPEEAQGGPLTATELLDRGSERIEAELADQGSIQADLLDVMSRAYQSQGAYVRSEELARRALTLRANDAHAFPQSILRLAEAVHAQSRFEEADSLFRLLVTHRRLERNPSALIEALEVRGRHLIGGLAHPDSVKAVFEEALALRSRHYGAEDPDRGRILHLYAGAAHIGGDYSEAERLFREAAAQFRRHPGDPVSTAETLMRLGSILMIRREYAEADVLFREAINLREEVYGRAHPATAELLVLLGQNLTRQGRFAKAEAILLESLSTYGQHSGRETRGYHSALRAQRLLLSDSGRYEEAIDVAREVVDLTVTIYGSGSRSHATNLGYYAQVMHNANRPSDALDAYREALPLVAAAFGEDAPFYAQVLADMARAMEALGRNRDAEALLTRAYDVMGRKLGRGSLQRSDTAYRL